MPLPGVWILGEVPAKGMVKAMKAQNNGPAKVAKDTKGAKKRPAAAGSKKPAEDALATLGSAMSLEEKMEVFAKKQNGDVNQFLDQLTSGQRESLWGKFARAREALKDKDVNMQWALHCKGPGSDPNKKALLKVFLENRGNLKKNDHFMNELVSLSKVHGQRDSEEWVPFAVILQRFGLQEAMRRAAWTHYFL